MNALGRHLLVELYDCDREALNDLDFIRDVMVKAAIDCGAVVLGNSFYHFNPQGVSGVVVIAESHLSIHTWPEYGYAAVDVFTCGTSVNPEKAAEVLIDRLGSKNHTLTEIARGVQVTV
ncbi:MAG: S-adenosylmethionine decarboxylase proenzyme [Chloroflexi bacterium RBG_13_52_12]|nr:MAG: S-adenosylmethionine decarboxylase proenzyme [Chloroflexi bacterium RBG_13_52_12]